MFALIIPAFFAALVLMGYLAPFQRFDPRPASLPQQSDALIQTANALGAGHTTAQRICAAKPGRKCASGAIAGVDIEFPISASGVLVHVADDYNVVSCAAFLATDGAVDAGRTAQLATSAASKNPAYLSAIGLFDSASATITGAENVRIATGPMAPGGQPASSVTLAPYTVVLDAGVGALIPNGAACLPALRQ